MVIGYGLLVIEKLKRWKGEKVNNNGYWLWVIGYWKIEKVKSLKINNVVILASVTRVHSHHYFISSVSLSFPLPFLDEPSVGLRPSDYGGGARGEASLCSLTAPSLHGRAGGESLGVRGEGLLCVQSYNIQEAKSSFSRNIPARASNYF